MILPKPHLEKLKSVLENDRLPKSDEPRIKKAIKTYEKWVKDMSKVEGSREEVVEEMVRLLNDYKRFIEVNTIFDSQNPFLYRQKGQLKLENTIVEEFVPHLVHQAIPELEDAFELGPQKCFSSIHFKTSLGKLKAGGDPQIKRKDQDFSISKKLYLKTAYESDFSDSIERSTYLGYVCAECKTNLDKTMFQEAVATAHDVKSAVEGAKYYLMCEWLDMTPISTAPTDIDEVMILRKGKRMPSSFRQRLKTTKDRKKHRDEYTDFLDNHKYSAEVFQRFVNHVVGVVTDTDPAEESVLESGFF